MLPLFNLWLTLLYQSVQVVVHIEGPLAGSALHPVLRECQAVRSVVFIEDVFRSGQLLPDAQPAVVVPVLEGIQTDICRGLVHGLQHEAQATVVVVHIIDVELFRAVHASFQQGTPFTVGKTITDVAVLTYITNVFSSIFIRKKLLG